MFLSNYCPQGLCKYQNTGLLGVSAAANCSQIANKNAEYYVLKECLQIRMHFHFMHKTRRKMLKLYGSDSIVTSENNFLISYFKK